MKKAVILGNTNLNYSWFVLTHRQGLKLNDIETFDIDYKSTSLEVIKRKILQIKPNYIFTHLSFHSHIHPINTILEFFKNIKDRIDVKVVHTCQDARTQDRYMGDLRGSFDAAFVGSYAMASNCLNAFKIPVFYMPYSSLTYAKRGKYDSKLAFSVPIFTGSPGAHRTGWADNRAQFIEDIQKVMTIKIFKTQSGEDLRSKTPSLSVSAKCILGLCVGYEIDGYMDVRPFQYLGTGAFMIMRKFKGMETYIPDDLYVPFYSYEDPKVVKELWSYWKDKNTEKMRKKAFEYVQYHHSSKQRIRDVLYKLEHI